MHDMYERSSTLQSKLDPWACAQHKKDKREGGVLLKICLSMLIIGFECNFMRSQTLSLISIFSILFQAKKLNFSNTL